jgi:hypothetical protein
MLLCVSSGYLGRPLCTIFLFLKGQRRISLTLPFRIACKYNRNKCLEIPGSCGFAFITFACMHLVRFARMAAWHLYFALRLMLKVQFSNFPFESNWHRLYFIVHPTDSIKILIYLILPQVLFPSFWNEASSFCTCIMLMFLRRFPCGFVQSRRARPLRPSLI